MMATGLDVVVADLRPSFEGETNWGPLRLAVRIYETERPAPAALLTSVRGVLFKRGSVVLVDEEVDAHIMPGGRIEPGETVVQTLERELLEECGWTIVNPRPFALIHFHHLTPKPEGYLYPYPDFLHLIFVGQAGRYDRRALKRAGEIETGSRLTPIRRAMSRIGRDQQALLAAAMVAKASP